MSINFHLLMHLGQSVRHTGPTWVTSCFPFEDLNGKLLKFIHGTSHVGLQIGSSVAHSIIISNIVENLNENSEIKKFCSDLLITGKRLRKTQKICERTYTIGKIKNYSHVPSFLREMLEQSGFKISGLNICTFRGIKKNGHVIYNINYKRSRLYASYGVLYKDESNKIRIGLIEFFFKLCYCNEDCKENCFSSVYIAIVKDGFTYNQFTTSLNMTINNELNNSNNDLIPLSHIYTFEQNASRKLILINSIESICFITKVEGKIYIGELINNVEFKGAD